MTQPISIEKFSLSQGVISPKAIARSDTDGYSRSLAQCVNAIIQPQGGANKRPGTQLINRLANIEHNISEQLIPFIFSREENYIIHIYNKSQDSGNDIQIDIHDPLMIDLQANNQVIRLTLEDMNDEIKASDIWYYQSGNSLFLCHQYMHPKILKRTQLNNINSWTIRDIPFAEMPYDEIINTQSNITLYNESGGAPTTTEQAKWLAVPKSILNTNENNIIGTILNDGTEINEYDENLKYIQTIATIAITKLNGIVNIGNDFYGVSRTNSNINGLYKLRKNEKGDYLNSLAPLGPIHGEFHPESITYCETIDQLIIAGEDVDALLRIPRGTNGEFNPAAAAEIIGTQSQLGAHDYYGLTSKNNRIYLLNNNNNRILEFRLNGNGTLQIGSPTIFATLTSATWQAIALTKDKMLCFATNGTVQSFTTDSNGYPVASTLTTETTDFRSPNTLKGATAKDTEKDNIFTDNKTKHIRFKSNNIWIPLIISPTESPPTFIAQSTHEIYAVSQIAGETLSAQNEFIKAQNETKNIPNRNTTEFRLGAFYENNYPAIGGFYKGRMWFGGTTEDTQRIFASAPQDFFNFATTNTQGEVLDSSGIDITIDNNTVNRINWLYFEKQLRVGTADAIYYIRGDTNEGAITPNNITVYRETRDGTAPIRPIGIDEASIYADRTRIKIRALAYNYDTDSHEAADLNIIADHMYKSPIKRIVFARFPEKYAFILTEDGSVVGMAYERQNNILGWFNLDFRQIGESSKITDLVVIPNSKGELDELYLLLDGGTGLRYLMKMLPLYEAVRGHDHTENAFMDYMEVIENPTDNSMIQNNYEGATIMADGIVLKQNATINQNTRIASITDIELPPNTRKLFIGYPYETLIEFLPLEINLRDGSSTGKTISIESITINLLASSNFIFQTSKDDRPTQAEIRNDKLLTGEFHIDDPKQTPKRNFQFIIKHDLPLPFNVLSLAFSANVSMDG